MTESRGAAAGGAAAPAPLSPPEPTPPTLTAPEPAVPVLASQAPAMAPQVDPRRLPALDDRVEGYLTALLKAQARSPEFARQAENVRTMGDADIRTAAETSDRLLQVPVGALQEGGLSQGSTVGRTLLELRRAVEDLDPSQATGPRKFLGIPFGDKVADYFRKYQGAQSHLDAILRGLREGQDELSRDNGALNLEKQNLWAVMGRLNAYIYVAEQLDGRLEEKIAELELVDPERARALSQDVLLHVRQKHQDLVTQLAVSVENYLAIDVVIKINVELIKGVDRASTTTVSALRTAVVVAQALTNQGLVLDRVTALDATTPDLVQPTSELLSDGSTLVQKQAPSAAVGLPQLQAAFATIHQTMDSIDAFRPEALSSLRATIDVLEPEVAKARSYLERVSRADADLASGSLELDHDAAG